MVLETEYDNKYYTVININQLSPATREEWFTDGFTWHEAINYVEHLLKISEDNSINNFRVEYAKYCDDISVWREEQEGNNNLPIFISFSENQRIETSGELFVLYEVADSDEDDNRLYSDDDDYSLHIELPDVLNVIPRN